MKFLKYTIIIKRLKQNAHQLIKKENQMKVLKLTKEVLGLRLLLRAKDNVSIKRLKIK